MKTLIYACKVYSEIYKSIQLDELKKELEIISNAIEKSKNQENIEEDLKIVENTIEKLKTET